MLRYLQNINLLGRTEVIFKSILKMLCDSVRECVCVWQGEGVCVCVRVVCCVCWAVTISICRYICSIVVVVVVVAVIQRSGTQNNSHNARPTHNELTVHWASAAAGCDSALLGFLLGSASAACFGCDSASYATLRLALALTRLASSSARLAMPALASAVLAVRAQYEFCIRSQRFAVISRFASLRLVSPSPRFAFAALRQREFYVNRC